MISFSSKQSLRRTFIPLFNLCEFLFFKDHCLVYFFTACYEISHFCVPQNVFLNVFLRAKGFPWISPVGHILAPEPRFDREFVTTFQGHGSVSGKSGMRFEMNFVFSEGQCLSK